MPDATRWSAGWTSFARLGDSSRRGRSNCSTPGTAFQIFPGDIAADRAGLTELEMDALILLVVSELAPAEISDRLDREQDEVQEILAAAFEKLRRIPVKEMS